MRRPRAHPPATALVAAAALALIVPPPARPADRDPAPDRRPDVVYVPTPQEVVDRMLDLAEVRRGDVVYDLGCGDGRIVVSAAKGYGARAVGIDIDPRRVRESLDNARRNGVSELVTVHREDLFATDLAGASVVTLYLVPNLIDRLTPRLAHLKPGTRVVSHSFPIRGVRPARTSQVTLAKGGVRRVYLYVTPFADTASSRSP